MANQSASSGGISFAGALFLVFLVLKLLAVSPVAQWSWLWVTAPLWGGAAIVLSVWAIVFMVITAYDLMAKLKRGKDWSQY